MSETKDKPALSAKDAVVGSYAKGRLTNEMFVCKPCGRGHRWIRVEEHDQKEAYDRYIFANEWTQQRLNSNQPSVANTNMPFAYSNQQSVSNTNMPFGHNNQLPVANTNFSFAYINQQSVGNANMPFGPNNQLLVGNTNMPFAHESKIQSTHDATTFTFGNGPDMPKSTSAFDANSKGSCWHKYSAVGTATLNHVYKSPTECKRDREGDIDMEGDVDMNPFQQNLVNMFSK